MIRSAAFTLILALVSADVGCASPARAGLVEITAKGNAAPAGWKPGPDGPTLEEFLRIEATRQAMRNARAQADGIAEAGGGVVGAVVRVEVFPDQDPRPASFTNALADETQSRPVITWSRPVSRGVGPEGAEITIQVTFQLDTPGEIDELRRRLEGLTAD